MQQVINAAGNINIYNIDLPCNVPGLCYDFTNVTDYLNLASVQEAIGVDNITWETCNFQVNGDFFADIEQSYLSDLPFLLSMDVGVFIYNGMLDLICNYVGGDMWTAAMDWPGQGSFNDQKFTDWVNSKGVTVGHYKTYDNFTFLEVEKAGHMVPHDQPEVALNILKWVLQQ